MFLKPRFGSIIDITDAVHDHICENVRSFTSADYYSGYEIVQPLECISNAKYLNREYENEIRKASRRHHSWLSRTLY